MAKKEEKKEKRIYPRKVLRSEVIFEDETGEGFIYFYSTDISLGGLFLESDIPLKLGTQVSLSFSLREGGLPIHTQGEVVRLERESGGNLPMIGVGIQFVSLTPESAKRVQDYVS